MKLVSTIKRINMLNKAMERMPLTEKYYDIYDRLWDKRAALREELNGWRKESKGELRKARRHQIELVCRLLDVSKHHITSGL